ncbi:MDR family MFS transporter [Streptomyces sp. NBC_01615]|uniref:MDR family MFS transporter n=1 Tax=Streptomyces sp. NBC_01615 TaxID=2975898 RepID=UPI00386A711E
MDQLIAEEDPTRIGPYRLIGRLGAGGMGLVYLGRSEVGRTVAVKVVQAEYAGNPEFRKRFAREVAAARRVGGSWTAAVLDADTEADVPWVATQYIPGPDLHSVVAKDFGPLPEHSAHTLANRLALALQAVHEAGLIHRDLKPSNVLVTVDGPRVIDFGIARAMDSLAGDSLHTRTGMLIGSPGFMSPEQVRGLELTPASDVFCLGAVLVYATTGRLLFGATDTGLNAHLFRVAEEEADLTGVPATLVDLVRECLHKDPARRPTPQQVAVRTTTDRAEEWLPGAVLAQLGRHAAKLLDYAPTIPAPATPATPDPATPVTPPDPRISPPQPQPQSQSASHPASQPPPPPPAYAPTAPVHFGPAQAFGPPPVTSPVAWPAAPPAPVSAHLQDAAPPHPRRWWALVMAALVQLMVLIEVPAFNMAMPSLQADLHISSTDLGPLSFVYAVAFVGLLLLGGHLADLVGRKRMLIIGLVCFAVAAAMGGSASVAGTLIFARALQGVAAALLSSSALSLVATGFTDPKERGRAFGVYAAVAGGGTALGLFTGGLIVEGLSWRVALYANIPLAVIAFIGVATLPHDLPGRTGARFDVLGVLLSSVGFGALVYGFNKADPLGWTDPVTVALLGGGVLLLIAFAWWQTRTSSPILPASLIKDRNRVGCLLAMVLAGAGFFAVFPVLAYFQGNVLGYAPSRTGVAFLPMVVALVIGSTQVSARLLHRAAPRVLIVAGLVTAALGLLLLTGLTTDSAYATQVLPGLLLTGFGIGLAFTPVFAVATGDPASPQPGGASAGIVTAHEVGVAIGVALISSVVTARVNSALASGRSTSQQIPGVVLSGYADTLWWAAGGMLLAGLVAALMITARAPKGIAT